MIVYPKAKHKVGLFPDHLQLVQLGNPRYENYKTLVDYLLTLILKNLPLEAFKKQFSPKLEKKKFKLRKCLSLFMPNLSMAIKNTLGRTFT